MNYFLDSSAVVKRYVNEAGSGWMHQHVFTGNHRLLIAQITPVEVMSAVYRQHRSGNYSERDADAIKLWLKRHLRRDYHQVIMTPNIVEEAQVLLKKYSLKAYDAVQLASALFIHDTIKASNKMGLTFLTADIKLFNIAKSENLTVINPQTP